MPKTKVITIIGTRPELIKLSPVLPLLEDKFDHVLVHSGQHYDYKMDEIFFKELQLPEPDYKLDVGSGSHAQQTARLLSRLEPVLLQEQPDALVVLGDTNTTLAGMMTTAKLNITGVHLEAGCRSFNRKMPEEINRIVADHICDYCFAPGEREHQHLLSEGIQPEQIYVVGSTAIDACRRNQTLAQERTLTQDLGLIPDNYILLTLHRAENTIPQVLAGIMQAINDLAEKWPVIFPIHPRTRNVWDKLEMTHHPNLHIIEPVGYLDILNLILNARAVMTDSGGLQEETAALGTPLLIVRQETEWMYLVEGHAAALVGNTFESITTTAPPLLNKGWDAFEVLDMTAQEGTAQRIVTTLLELLTS